LQGANTNIFASELAGVAANAAVLTASVAEPPDEAAGLVTLASLKSNLLNGVKLVAEFEVDDIGVFFFSQSRRGSDSLRFV